MLLQSHYFFILSYSSLAILNSLSFFNLLWSFLMFFKMSLVTPLVFSMSLSSMSGFLWWSIYSSEINYSGMFNYCMESGLKMSMLLFISSEVFFFFSFFWSYFHYSLSPCMEGMFLWPPYLVEMFSFDQLPLVNTLILLSSGVSVTVSHMFMLSGNKFMKELFMFITVILGLTFSFFQAMEYMESFFSINDGNFGSSFYVLTGFHGVHVVIGSIFLLYSFSSSLNYISRLSSFMSFELASWYWHFVDVVWVFLFYFIYYKNF